MKENILENAQYLSWRAIYITLKPVSIFLAIRLVSEEFASELSLAILISGSLMASLSFGSFRNIFKNSKNQVRADYYSLVRRSIFFINCILIFLAVLISSYVIGQEELWFIGMFVLTEHIIHDESRILLYSGSRRKWAMSNCLKTFFIPIIPLILYFTKESETSIIITMLIIFVINIIISILQKGLCFLSLTVLVNIFRCNFYKEYIKQLNYFISATTSRVIQQSDKFLFSIISFEFFWVYTLLAQIANIPLLMFELVYVSKLKSKISKMNNYYFSWLTKQQMINLLCISLLCSVIYFIIGLEVNELLEDKFLFLASSILVANFLSATSMMNSERLFWYLRNPREYRKIEVFAFFSGHLIFAPLLIWYNLTYIVKIPNLISTMVKLRNSRKWLEHSQK